MQDYAKCMVYYVLLFVDNNKKSPNKTKNKKQKKTKENSNNKTDCYSCFESQVADFNIQKTNQVLSEIHREISFIFY